MKVSMEWINELVDISGVSPKEYADKMTMSGSKVEGIEDTGAEISNVVVGKILKIEKHPDADKLVVCQLDVGGEENLQIVTHAPNVFEGQLVPVALHKSKLPGGVEITKGKLRGVLSQGMMCSHDELGIDINAYPGACEDGIMTIEEGVAVGTDIKEVLGLNKHIVEFEITPNRQDCLSVIGLARETAVTFNKPLNLPEVEVKGSGDDVNKYIAVEVENKELCKRYTARVVKNVKIGPSPKWLVERLTGCGLRSINNIVDITNYILLEYGQPMHAFDISYLEGNKIVVRDAKEGEKITTLDGIERELDPSMLVIADTNKPVAIAGIMGGENSDIKDDTKTIVFETANFDGKSIRLSSKKLGLRTDASGLYEKFLDPFMVKEASDRACQLVEMMGAGEVVDGIIDVCSAVDERKWIEFNPEKINSFLGTDISAKDMEDTLKKLDFEVKDGKCLAPTYRQDVEFMADIAEEIVRIYGYDKIESSLMRGETTPGGKDILKTTEDKVKNVLTGLGLFEIITYSFVSPKTLDILNVSKESNLRNMTVISNPLGEENSVMRTTTIPSMMETLARNYNLRNESAWLFEIGKTYIPVSEDKIPDEYNKITIGIYGNNADFFSLKGVVEELANGVNVKGMEFTAEKENPSFHPGRCAKILLGEKPCGIMGEIHPLVAKKYGFDTKVYVAEIDFMAFFEAVDNEKQYVPMPKFPAVTRDLAVLIDNSVPVADIEKVIKASCGKILEKTELFDIYKGKQIPEDKKSVAFALTMRSSEGTLAEEEINNAMNKIVKNIEKELGGVLR
ncbi:MAG: phenylalanine--tRNA ligase subunit beta [Clostridia bacterium]|nr:phenylalanine--tRNA ligase subunit beta [Clostridia bacterium]